MKRKVMLIATLLLVAISAIPFLPLPAYAQSGVVTFPDPNLQAAIRQAINKPTGDIYQSDLLALTTLYAGDKGITNLSGLEYCTNLTATYLINNHISDISPLASLTKLTRLDLGKNQITEILPLSSLNNMTNLNLWSNQIIDISALSSMTDLLELVLNGNQISNISPLAFLTNLTELYLDSNPISSISPLSTLTKLTELGLYNNRIGNISPLASLTNLTELHLGDNQISDISPLASLTNLDSLLIYNNKISNISPLAGLINLHSLVLDTNRISDISSLVANAGLATGDIVQLRGNPLSADSLNTYIPQLQGRGVTVLYDVSPTVTTNDASNITIKSAKLNGNLNNLDNVYLVNVSFQWGISTGIYNNETSLQTMNATGAFSYDLNGLNPGTKYYFRAKTVGNGTRYGEERSFITPALIALQITPVNPKVIIGTGVQLTATGIYSNGSRANLTTTATWTSSNPSVFTIGANTGLAAPVAVGTTTITATLGGVTASTNLTVTAAVLQSIAITPANPTVARGVARQFTAIGTYSDASTANITTSAAWTSSDPAKATIGANSGLVQALAEGQTTITAALYGVNGNTILTVASPTPVAVTIGAIKQNPTSYEGQNVRISGVYRGFAAGYGKAPMGRSDFVIEDATGFIYVTGSAMGLRYPQDVGKPVTLSGTVRLKNGVPYIEVR